MFDMSLGEMLVIAVLVLVFFDADQLPDLMRKFGRIYGQVRGASDDLRRAFNVEVAKVDSEKRRAELERRREELKRLRPAPRADQAGGDPANDAVMRPDPMAALRAARQGSAAAAMPLPAPDLPSADALPADAALPANTALPTASPVAAPPPAEEAP